MNATLSMPLYPLSRLIYSFPPVILSGQLGLPHLNVAGPWEGLHQ